MTILEAIMGGDSNAQPKTASDMQKVLDALAGLGGGMGLVVGGAMSAEKMAANGLKKAFGTDTLL